MESFEREGKVSIWVFRKAENPEDAEKDVLEEFCGVDYYDRDFQEGMSFTDPAPLASILGDLSYSESFINAVLAAARKEDIKEVFGVLAHVVDPILRTTDPHFLDRGFARFERLGR